MDTKESVENMNEFPNTVDDKNGEISVGNTEMKPEAGPINKDQEEITDCEEKPKPKKVGRPSKAELLERKILPKRESQRLKKVPQVLHYKTLKVKCVWSNKEKLQLLKALEEHGEVNINELKRHLPQRNVAEISAQIKMWKDFASTDHKKKMVFDDKSMTSTVTQLLKLDKWIEHFMKDSEITGSSQFALSNAFMLIAEYGKLPPPSACNGVDFREMYRLLHCLLNGTPYHGMSQESAAAFNQALAHMNTQLRGKFCDEHLQPYLMNCVPLKRPKRTYARPPHRGKGVKPSRPDAVLRLPGMNPLNLPVRALVSPCAVSQDDSSSSEDDLGQYEDDNFCDSSDNQNS